MKQAELIARLREQAKHDHNARVLLDHYSRTTPESRKARREAAIARYRQQVAS